MLIGIYNYYSENRSVIWTVFSLLVAVFSLSGCTSARPLPLSYFYGPGQTPAHFAVCHGYGCRKKSNVSLPAAEWRQIKEPLNGKAASPAQEREQIAAVIAEMEWATGEEVGTYRDVGGATMFGHDPYQLDCIDEAVNTSLYLSFLEQDGVLKWHDVVGPARRGTFIDGEWPHNTAVVAEKESGAQYVIDSWFSNNGEEPHIVPLDVWLGGWRPDGVE